MDIFLKVTLTLTVLAAASAIFVSRRHGMHNLWDYVFRYLARSAIFSWLTYTIAWVWL